MLGVGLLDVCAIVIEERRVCPILGIFDCSCSEGCLCSEDCDRSKFAAFI